MSQKQMLYVDNDELNRHVGGHELRDNYFCHEILTAGNAHEVTSLLDDGSISVEHLVLVCADGTFDDGTTGWEVVEELRRRGYEGPTLYIGKTPLPPDKEPLFDDSCAHKFGDFFIDAVILHKDE